MACLGMQISYSCGRRASVSGGASEDIHRQFRPSLVEFRDDRSRRCRSTGMCVSKLGKSGKFIASAANSLLPSTLSEVEREGDKKNPAIPPQLDHLMKQSVTEIVKNIKEAPFLVHVYSEGDNTNADADQTSLNKPLKLEIERATSESWPFIRQRWEGVNSPAPDGVILVEELDSEEAIVDIDKEEIASSTAPVCTSNKPSSTKVWGLLVQGRGASCPSCYILKTCRVQCCSGFSTHFCLAKVDCFGKSIDFHLNRMWLQR